MFFKYPKYQSFPNTQIVSVIATHLLKEFNLNRFSGRNYLQAINLPSHKNAKRWKGKAIPVTGRGDSYIFKTIDSQMAVRSALRAGRPPFTPKKIRPRGHSAARRIRSIEKSSDIFGSRTGSLPACSIMPRCSLVETQNKIQTCVHVPADVSRVPLRVLVPPV
jgi:hypothetical protein